jgi:hypothetical protein
MRRRTRRFRGPPREHSFTAVTLVATAPNATAVLRETPETTQSLCQPRNRRFANRRPSRTGLKITRDCCVPNTLTPLSVAAKHWAKKTTP